MDEHRSKEIETKEAVNSEDLLSQLKEKLRTQAHRIRSLESYKSICEERISELFPSHPFPISQEHLGSGRASYSQELLNSKQKIVKLEHQLSQSADLIPNPANSITYNKLHELYTLLHQRYNAMMKEKNDLEESLRKEVLTSEEQRAYIEVLKQALEYKLESLGLKGVDANNFAEFSHMMTFADEAKKETSRLSTKLADYESQFKIVTENLRLKTNECRDLIAERDELTEQLHQAAEALQYAEEEVQKLEEEKANLLEYVDSQTKIEREHEREIMELRTQLINTQDDVKKYSKQLSSANDENKKSNKELDMIKGESSRIDKNLKEAQQTISNLRARIEEKDKMILKYKDENNKLSIQNSSFQAEIITLNDSFNRVDKELKGVRAELDNEYVEENKMRDNISDLQDYSQKIQEEKCMLEKKCLEMDYKIVGLQGDYNNLQDKYEQTLKRLNATAEDVERFKAQQALSAKKEELQENSIMELKKQLQSSNTESESILSLYYATNKELQETKLELERTSVKAMSYSQENIHNDLKIKELSMKIETEQTNTKIGQEELYNLKCKINELNSSLSFANDTIKQYEIRCKKAEDHSEALSSMLSQSQTDLSQEKYTRAGQEEQLSSCLSENERLKYELSRLKEIHDLSCSSVQKISSRIFPINSPLFKEISKTVQSNGFVLSAWIDAAVQEISEMSKKCTDSFQTIETIKHKNSLLTQDLDAVSQEQAAFKNREILLKTQVESASKENAYIRESMKSQINSLQQDIIALRNNLQGMHEENEQLMNKNRVLNLELNQTKSRLSSQEQSISMLDKKNRGLIGEKDHLESLLSSYKSQEMPFSVSFHKNN